MYIKHNAYVYNKEDHSAPLIPTSNLTASLQAA